MAWRRVGWVVLFLMLFLPWVGWLRLTTANPAQAVLDTPLWVWLMGMLLAGGLAVCAVDRWAGLLGVYLVLRTMFGASAGAFEAVLYVGLGLATLLAVRHLPAERHGDIRWALLVGGLVQVGYVAGQWAGYDWVWRGPEPGVLRMVGTLGNESFVGAYLALLMPLAPLWLVPIFLGGAVMAKSATGVVAGVAGVLWARRAPWWVWVSGGALAWGLMPSYKVLSLSIRSLVWEAAVRDTTWGTAVFGHGLGAWFVRMPTIQPWAGVMEYFLQAHNEYLQLWYEGGVIALGLLAGWLWTWRRAFVGRPFGGALVVVALVAGLSFPFHLAVLGLLSVVLMGLATGPAVEAQA